MDGELPVYIFAAADGVPAEFAFGAGVEVARWHSAPAEAVPEAPRGEGSLILSPGSDHAYKLIAAGRSAAHLILLTPDEALSCYRAPYQRRERIFLSLAALLVDGERLELRAGRVEQLGFAVYPPLERAPRIVGAVQSETAGPFTPDVMGVTPEVMGVTPEDMGVAPEDMGVAPEVMGVTRYRASRPAKNIILAARRVKSAGSARAVPLGSAGVAHAPGDADFAAAEVWQVDLPPDLFGLETVRDTADVRLVVDYIGDAARAYLGDELVADDFYFGCPWEIGLRRFAPAVLAQGLSLRFLPLRRDAPIYLPGDWRAQMGDAHSMLEVREIRAEVEYRMEVG